MKSFVFYTFHQIFIGYQTEDDEMGVTCRTYGREEKCTTGVCRVTWRTELRGRRKHWCECNIKMDHKEIVGPDVDWVDLAQNRNKWRVIVNTVMKFWFYRIWGIT